MLRELLGIKRAVKYSPLIIAVIYLMFSTLYILFSDWIVARNITDITFLSRVQTLKGLGFVVFSAALLYFLIRTSLNRVYKTSKALSQAEEKVRLIFESITDGIVVFDSHNKVIEANTALMELFGTKSKAQLLGQNLFIFFAVEEHTRLRQAIDNTIALGHSGVLEFTINRDNQKQIPIQINASILRNAGNKSVGIVAVIENISERKQAQSQLQELYLKEKTQREELQEESRARGMFIDVLAHELRTPLTPIVASGGMLSDYLSHSKDEIKHKLIANIVDGSETLTRRLEELLDIGRVSRGTFVLVQQRVNTTNFLYEVINRLKPILEKHSQQLRVNIPAALPPIRVDPNRLEQVIINLVSVAAKFSPPNSEIIFRAGNMEGVLFFEIEDQGAGISDEELSRLFSPYHRTEQDRQKYPGIGLGLAVTKQIIEAHGGKIQVTGNPGKGNLFRVEI
jgi:PAS domain S-box-containing protein